MKRKVISIILIGIMAYSVYACGSLASKEADYNEINEPIQEEASESEIVQDKEVSEEAEDTRENNEVQQTEDDKSAEPIYIIEPQLTQDDDYEMQDWQIAYVEYIEGLEWNRDCTYSLIYVDEDDIPELVIDSGFEAGGCEILTYHSGEIDVLQTDRRLFYYIEKQNLFNNTGGKMGYYFDRIYSIENGKWVRVADGEWTETMGDDDWVYRYEWDGKEVKEDVYNKSLNAVFDMEQKIEPERYYIMDEMMALFQTGDVASRKHRYELFVEDVTWDEAKRRCEERGGYLATVTSTEEYERIQKGIVDSGLTDTAFWVGACHNEDVLGQYVFGFGWLEPNKDLAAYGMLGHFNALFIFWEPDEPSYEVEVDGKTIKEDFAYLMYDETEERCFLYDAPMDMLSIWPEYTGKIGYICEYDSIVVMTKETHYHADGSVSDWYEYEYDGLGNQTGYIHYYEDGSFHNSKYRQEYDDRGNMTKHISYHDDGSINFWYEHEYDRAGKRTKSIKYKADGNLDSWSEYGYDSKGNRVKWINYYSTGSVSDWYEYEYDSAGHQTKENWYSSHGTLKSWEEREYDSVGNLIKSSGYNSKNNDYWWYEYEHDSEGNMTKSISYLLGGSLDSWSEYGYDSEGNQVKWIDYNADGSISRWHGNEYDSEGKKIKSIWYNEDGSVDWWCEYEYNSEGNTTQETFYDADGHISAWEKYEYDSRGNKTKQSYWHEEGNTQEYVWEYDNMGNLTKHTEYRQDGLYEWYECEYITITPRSEVTVSVNR